MEMPTESMQDIVLAYRVVVVAWYSGGRRKDGNLKKVHTAGERKKGKYSHERETAVDGVSSCG